MQALYKSLFLLAFSFIISLPSYAQYKYGKTLVDSALFAANSLKNQLYVGIDNPLVLNTGTKELPGDYILTATNGTIFFDSINFVTIPIRSGISRILLSKIIDNDTILIGYRFFKVLNLPDPKLQIDTLVFSEEDYVYKHFILYADSLSIYFTSDIPGSENWFRIVRFTLGYIYGGLYRSYAYNGNKISLGMKKVINTLGPGKEIIIKPYVEGEGGLSKDLPIYRLKLF